MSFLEEYFRLQKEYDLKYGDRTLLFMQNGSFYEFYYLLGNSQDLTLIENISDLLGLRLALKDGKNRTKAGTISNPYLIGFPCTVYEKYKNILLNNNYTLVRYDQTKADKTKREFIEVSSPLTDNNYVTGITNNIMTIYIETLDNCKKIEQINLLIGVSVIDVISGKNEIMEIYSEKKDTRYSINELYHILTSYKPKELQIMINLVDLQLKDSFEKYILDVLELSTYPIVNISFDVNKDILDWKYQEFFLNGIFKPEIKKESKIILNKGGLIDIFIELGIERLKYGTISYLILLKYCQEHNPLLIKKIFHPKINLNDVDRLDLNYNAIVQLSLVQSNVTKVNYRIGKKKNFDTLLSVLSNCNTIMGKRLLRDKLLQPITNIETLRSSYNLIEYLRNNREYSNQIVSILREFYDLERLNSKFSKGTLTPKEFSNLFHNYLKVIEIINLTIPHLSESNGMLYIFPKKETLEMLNSAIRDVYITFNLEILSECNIIDGEMTCKSSPFNQGISKDCDRLQSIISKGLSKLNEICSHIDQLIGKSLGPNVKVDSFSKKMIKGKSVEDDEDEDVINMKDLAIYLTDSKTNKLKQNLKNLNKELCGELYIESKNKKYVLKSSIIDELCESVLNSRRELAVILTKEYKEICDVLGNKYDMSGIINFIMELDVAITNAENSLKYAYYKPEIIKKDVSFLDIKNVRHPLIERIISMEYVPNDVKLSGENPYGMILYGCNSTGKTALCTSIGLAIIMAQAGMWVAGSLTYSPYNKILTRLSGQDDILKGHSSFVVEMLELRNILRNADEKSLVLGDELCRGTESLSGTALTISTIEDLTNKKASYIFSTHLHDIPSNSHIEELTKNNLLRISHLSSVYDPVTETLIYNRKLQDGPGESIYGLEVAKSLDIDVNFIKNAQLIRKELLNESMVKRSRYNSGVFVSECQLCKSKERLQTHHIKEQSKADEYGLIGHIHKNVEFNLLVLCEDCHKKLHKENRVILTTNTSKGIILDIKE